MLHCSLAEHAVPDSIIHVSHHIRFIDSGERFHNVYPFLVEHFLKYKSFHSDLQLERNDKQSSYEKPPSFDLIRAMINP